MRVGAAILLLGTLAACEEPRPTRLNFDWDAFVTSEEGAYHPQMAAAPQPAPAPVVEEPAHPVARAPVVVAESLAPPPSPRPKPVSTKPAKSETAAPFKTVDSSGDEEPVAPAVAEATPEPRERPAYVAPKPATHAATHTARTENADDAAPVEKPAKPVKTAALPAGHFAWPVHGKVIGEFGAEAGGQRSDGINIAAPADTPITAAASGTVGYAGGDMKSYGNLVVIRHDGNFFTAYAHASRLVVKPGDHVSAGQVIGYVGQTGDVDSPQLHFEIRKGREPQDPVKFLAAKG